MSTMVRSAFPDFIGKGAKVDKVEKVMGEFKRGKLHSGSKKGPIVKKRVQAVAIALSEKRKAEHKSHGSPFKIGIGGHVNYVS